MSSSPPGNDFTFITAGGDSNFALSSLGEITAWGGNGGFSLISGAPTGLGWFDVSCGGNHALAVASDGAIYAWGFDFSGQVSLTPSGQQYVAVSAGPNHSVALHDPDCNGNGQPDSQDLLTGIGSDCNGNDALDGCDLASGVSTDIDGDGLPDECVAPPLMADMYELSVATGGTQTFTLTAPVSFGLYLLLGTASGTSPGTPSGGFVIPLNVDAYLIHTALSPNAAPLASSFGALTPSGSSGTATASFALPAAFSPSLVGLTLHHAYVTIDLISGNINFVSNAVPLALVP